MRVPHVVCIKCFTANASRMRLVVGKDLSFMDKTPPVTRPMAGHKHPVEAGECKHERAPNPQKHHMKKSIVHRPHRRLQASMLASAMSALLALTADPVSAQVNTRYGAGALQANGGSYNSAFGFNALYTNTSGSNNTAIGGAALYFNRSGQANTAAGSWALYSNTSGHYNTATGHAALYLNTTGGLNTGTGFAALYWNSTGSENTAHGFESLNKNTTGYTNTADGYRALYLNTTGNWNTAVGAWALANNNGSDNTATGHSALYSNTSGGSNTASGNYAMYSNTTGNQNASIGFRSMFYNQHGVQNTAVGAYALNYNVSGNYNIAVGWSAGYVTTGFDNIVIGNLGVYGENSTIRIGTQGRHTSAFMAGVHGATVAGGVGVVINNQGKLGTTTSSRKFKTDIADMNHASDALLSLRPVTFKYKPELDREAIPQFGLIAEEVAEVSPDLIARDEKGDIYTVRYDAINAMLLNEFLKQDKSLRGQAGATDEQERKLAAQEQTIAKQQEQIKVLSQQLAELSRMAEQVKHKVD